MKQYSKTQSEIKKPGGEHCSEKKAGDAEKRNPCQWKSLRDFGLHGVKRQGNGTRMREDHNETSRGIILTERQENLSNSPYLMQVWLFNSKYLKCQVIYFKL